jgi:hypothetical protein
MASSPYLDPHAVIAFADTEICDAVGFHLFHLHFIAAAFQLSSQYLCNIF